MSLESRTIGVGLISVGWMGKLHSRAYQAVPYVYPELGLKTKLVIAADTEPSRVQFARDVLGYAAHPTSCTQRSASPPPRPENTSGSKSRSVAVTKKQPPCRKRQWRPEC